MSKLALSMVVASLLVVHITHNAYGQYTSVAGGTTSSPLPWITNSTWVGNSAPSTSSPSSSVNIGNGVYASVVSLNSNTTFNASVTITVQSNSTLIVNGDLHLASNITLVVQSGATLTVTGSFYTDNAGGTPKLQSNGAISITGSMIANGTCSISNGSTNSSAKITIGSNLSIANSGSPVLTNAGIINVSGYVDNYGSLTNSGTMTVTGNYTAENSGGQLTTNTGTLTISGNAYAYGQMQLTPGASASSEMVVTGSLTITANQNMNVGTSTATNCASYTYYADLVVKTDINLTGSGDIQVYPNGRMVVAGNINGSTSSGTLVTVDCGGQTYVNGNINLGTGGGNTVTNSNGSSSPTGSNASPIIGLYVNGTTTAQTTTGTIGTKSQLQTNDLSFYNYVTGLGILPITLSYFGIEKVSEESVFLNWSTASEKNFDYFSLQKSADGKSFYEIAQVQGHGTTNVPHNYSYEDKSPLIGKNYYRLTSVDFDNYQETFKVVEQDYTGAKDFSVSPNPTDGTSVTFNINFEEANGNVTIYDQLGSPIASYQLNETSNVLFANPMKSGIYLARYSSPAFNKAVRFVVK